MIMAIVWWLVWLAVGGTVAYVCWWLNRASRIPEPFKTVFNIVICVASAFFVIWMLLIRFSIVVGHSLGG